MNFNKLKIFIDFDGTITTTDVAEHFFLKFGDEKKVNEIIKNWIDKKITAPQMWKALCKTVENFNLNEFENFIDTIELDDAFLSFVEYCKKNNLTFTIVSDGFDFYINKILAKVNLQHMKVYCNMMEFKHNKLIPSFPYTDEECGSCANCKRNRIIDNSGDDEFTLYIGDGWSDVCVIQHCDYILAKNSLLKYCEKNRISYFPFNNFNNVIKRIEELRTKRRLKKRHQAVLKRKEVYKQG